MNLDSVKQFLGRRIVFSMQGDSRRLTGILERIEGGAMVISFRGGMQLYDLNAITSIQLGFDDENCNGGNHDR